MVLALHNPEEVIQTKYYLDNTSPSWKHEINKLVKICYFIINYMLNQSFICLETSELVWTFMLYKSEKSMAQFLGQQLVNITV